MWLHGVLVGLLYASHRGLTILGVDLNGCESAGCFPVPENVICGLGAKAGAIISDDWDFYFAIYFSRGISWTEGHVGSLYLYNVPCDRYTGHYLLRKGHVTWTPRAKFQWNRKLPKIVLGAMPLHRYASLCVLRVEINVQG